MVSDIRPHAQRRLDRGEKTHDRAVELGVVQIHQIAAENHQVGMQRIDPLRQTAQLGIAPHERAHVQVGELHDPQAVETPGQPRTTERHLAHVIGRAAVRSTPHEPSGHDGRHSKGRAAQPEQPEKIIGQSGQHREQVDEEDPHGDRHPQGRMFAGQQQQKHRHDRQQVRRQRRDQEEAARTRRGVRHAAAIKEEVGRHGSEPQENDDREQHDIINLGVRCKPRVSEDKDTQSRVQKQTAPSVPSADFDTGSAARAEGPDPELPPPPKTPLRGPAVAPRRHDRDFKYRAAFFGIFLASDRGKFKSLCNKSKTERTKQAITKPNQTKCV